MNIFLKSETNKDEFETIEILEFNKKIKPNDLFKIVNDENNSPIKFIDVINKAKYHNHDIFIINNNVNPKIVKIMDMQKYIYELKKAKKEQDKKQKAQQIKTKEIRISLNISEHDLDIKVNHTKSFINDGYKVKFLLKLHGREGNGEAGKKYVNDFFINVINTKFMDYNVTPVKYLGNNIFVDVSK